MSEIGLGEWRAKAWGRTRTIFRDDKIEIVECEIKKGGYSSEHLHRRKHNEFRVIEGWLRVAESRDRDWPVRVESSELLHNTMQTTVPAGVRHQFIALEDTRLIETYLPAGDEPIDPDDIERFSEGGLRA